MSSSRGPRCGWKVIRGRASAVLVATGEAMAKAARQVEHDMKLGAGAYHRNSPTKVVLAARPEDEVELRRRMEARVSAIAVAN